MSDIVNDLIQQEEQRQLEKVGLIPSENNTSPAVLSVLGSCLSSKYAEGYPGRRYYEGNQLIDQIENLAIDRAKALFGVPYVNVQPYSGSPANTAIQFAMLEPGDTLMGLKLGGGGHLTHGHPKVTFSGRFYNAVQYGLDDNDRIDFDAMFKMAEEVRPKVIYAGTTAYPFNLDFAAFREVADAVGASVVADISHITGLVVGGQHESPVPYADAIMTTTHKTLRGPRGAMILVTERGLARDPKLGAKIDKAIIPGLQGGPHNETTAGIAVALEEAARPSFSVYTQQVIDNAQTLAATLREEGVKLVGDGTDNHLIVIDLSPISAGLGTQVAYAMDVAGMYANRNTVPNEPGSPFYPSGVRIGTPLVTTRGMKASEMQLIGRSIAHVIRHVQSETLPVTKKGRRAFVRDFQRRADQDPVLLGIAEEIKAMAINFPLFQY
ncbi:MAG: serine hydroxymethyltransferase [Candidatus Promineifilaceae bacterium]